MNSAGVGEYSSPFVVHTLSAHICATELEVPIYPGSLMLYNWTQTEAGNYQKQQCPDICKEYISYSHGTVLERKCKLNGNIAIWQNIKLTTCGIDTVTLKLCETTKVLNFTIYTVTCFF